MPITTINPDNQASSSSVWTYFDLTTADGSSDTNSLVNSGPTYNSSTKENTVAIDRDQVGPILDTDDVAFWHWDTGYTAGDDFDFQFELHFTDDADMQSSNIAVWFGVTSDLTNMNTYSYGAGANYQTIDLRGWRVKGTTRSVGGIGASTEGIKCFCIRAGGSNAGIGNVANDYRMQALDSSDWTALSSFYGVSTSALNANASSDSLHFFLAIGVINAAASIETVKFKLKVSPVVVNDI